MGAEDASRGRSQTMGVRTYEALQNVLRPGGLATWQTRRALAYIEATLGSKLAIGDIADLVALSEGHFRRAFKHSLGSSPMTYVAMRRVERAKVLMASTREGLTDIALACGFADQSHFNRSFRRIVGMSPGLWRRNRAIQNPARPHSESAVAVRSL
jgi:AraC family transcriptional regulator